MAAEKRRACGYRKVGGLYLCGSGEGMSCCKMPLITSICPTCGHGMRQTRGWTWIDPKPWLAEPCKLPGRHLICPLATPEVLGDRVGLLWVGTQFYPSPDVFNREANEMGISRRITAMPRGFKVGEHWVFLAHPRVKWHMEGEGADAKQVWEAGVFKVFKPSAVEKIVTETMAQDADEMQRLADRGITPVIVPDDDKDHTGSVYDKDEQLEMELEPS